MTCVGPKVPFHEFHLDPALLSSFSPRRVRLGRLCQSSRAAVPVQQGEKTRRPSRTLGSRAVGDGHLSELGDLEMPSLGALHHHWSDYGSPWGSSRTSSKGFKRYLDPPKPPQTSSQRVLGSSGSYGWLLSGDQSSSCRDVPPGKLRRGSVFEHGAWGKEHPSLEQWPFETKPRKSPTWRLSKVKSPTSTKSLEGPWVNCS